MKWINENACVYVYICKEIRVLINQCAKTIFSR